LSDYVFITLLALHVGGVITWMGSSAMYTMVIGPSIAKSDMMESNPEFAISILSRLSRFITATSITTLLAGFFLFDYISTVATYILPPGSRILFIYAGAILGFAAFVVTLAAVIPSTSRIIKILRAEQSNAGSTSGPVALANARRFEIAHSLRAIRSGLSAAAFILLVIFILMVLGTNL